jgi:hypothetical protein
MKEGRQTAALVCRCAEGVTGRKVRKSSTHSENVSFDTHPDLYLFEHLLVGSPARHWSSPGFWAGFGSGHVGEYRRKLSCLVREAEMFNRKNGTRRKEEHI